MRDVFLSSNTVSSPVVLNRGPGCGTLGCPEQAQGVPPISKFGINLLVNCSKGCRQIVIKPRNICYKIKKG